MRYRTIAALDWNGWEKTRQNSNQNKVLCQGRRLRASGGDKAVGLGDLVRRFSRLNDIINV
jgi:hypothetical protein